MTTRIPRELSAASVLDGMSDGFIALDRDWRYTYINARGAEMLGRPASSLVGRKLLEIFPEAAGTPFESAYRQVMAEAVPVHFEALYEPWNRWFEQHVYPTENGIAVFFIDITKRRRAAQLSGGQTRVLEMIAADTPIKETLDALIRVVEADSPELLGSILLLDEDGIHLRHAAAPSLPDAYCRSIDGRAVGPRAGSCGTAIHRGEAVFTEDIETDPLWDDYREIALAHGLRACWLTPIRDPGQRVLGSFALYARAPARPRGRHDRMIEMATHTAAIAIVKLRGAQDRQGLVHTLGERVKELTALHEAARLLQGARAIDQALLADLAALLPAGWQHPDICQARVTVGALAAATPGWRDSAWRLSAPVMAGEIQAGTLEVAYLEERSGGAQGLFLDDERRLLRSIASLLGTQLERIRVQSELRNREAMFRAVFENAAIGMTLVDTDLRLMRSNPAFSAMLGMSEAELRERGSARTWHPEDIDENLRLYRALAKGEIDHFQADRRYLRDDGSVVWGRVTVSGVPQEGSSPPFMIGMIEDITQRRENDESLRRFRAAMDASGDAILLVDRARMRYVDVNQTFCDLVGYAREEVIGMAPMDLFSADRHTLEREYDSIIADRNSAASRVEGEYRRKDGSVVPIETRRVALQVKEGWIIVGTARDITERKRAEARIEYLATYDGLTDLPNRNLIHDRISQAIGHANRGGRKFALLYLDLDRFKVINDGFGHPFGDTVLKAAAERVRAAVREGDTVARQGGDEFLVLLADLRKSTDVYLVAQKLLDALAQPFLLEGREIHLTTSIGASIYPQDGQTADALIGNADAAMYRAKDLGRNAYQFFTREMSDETQRRVELETRLRGAIAGKQLQLAYQPKVDLASGRINGCEALLRWTHPDLGAVSPARFIPVAEDSGLIVPIGDWALRTACAQNRAWQDAGLPPIVVSVNLSARQFLQQDVVAWVLGVLRETGLAPPHLELELTESLIVQDVDKAIDTVNRLKEAGVKLSIDDFGTGYSSLAYLKRFRVNTLKIDQSFVRNMLNEPDDASISLAVISLAHSLRLKLTAEGVETADQCKFLQLNRCDEIQGYYFSKPVPGAELEAMLRSGKRLA